MACKVSIENHVKMVSNQVTSQAKHATMVQAFKAHHRGYGLHLVQPHMAGLRQPKTEF